MRLLTFFLAILFSGTLSAQTAVHFDRPFHVAGEVTWFSVFLPQPAPPKVKVTIYAPGGEALDYFFLAADASGQASGYYRWPFDLPTGYYRFGLAGMTTEKEVVDFGLFAHAVYSDARPAATAAGNLLGTEATPAAGGLSIIATGEQVLISGLQDETYSVCVVNADVTGESEGFATAPFTEVFTWADTLFYPANVTDAAGTPVNTNLLPVFDPVTFNFAFAKSDAQGDFMLELGPFSDTKKMQVRATDGTDLRPSLRLAKATPLSTQPPVTEAVANYIDLSRRRRKIYQLFATVETEIDAQAIPQSRKLLTPNRSFNVQDYKAFPDMYNFFKEVAGELRVRVKKDNYSAQLYNAPNQRFFVENPLYIVDGKLTRDDNFVNNLSPSEVRYLAFYYVGSELRRDFPALGNNGVVQLETLRPLTKFPAADADDIFPVKGLQPTATFPLRDAIVSDVPALSPVLLWETGRASGTETLELPVTDDFGRYRVTVVARNKNGALRSVSQEFILPMK